MTVDKSQNNDSEELNQAKNELPFANKTRLIILQHPQEKKEALATVPLLLESLQNIELRIGLSWPNLKKILGEEVDYSKWAVIYLGTQSESDELLKSDKEVILSGKEKNPKKIEGIVLLDGSWREVKTLWWRNAWLLKLNRIVLNPKKASAYNSLRREPRKQSLSTIEAASLVLSEIEGNAELKSLLDSKLADLVEINKNKKTSAHRGKRRFRSRFKR